MATTTSSSRSADNPVEIIPATYELYGGNTVSVHSAGVRS